MQAHMRVARPTGDLEATARQYIEGLGFEQLGSFQDHAGHDGVMLGHPGAGYHLELTHHSDQGPIAAPSADNLLVFYVPDREQWAAACERMAEAGFTVERSLNPYWDRLGRTFADRDGYRVVLQQAAWE